MSRTPLGVRTLGNCSRRIDEVPPGSGDES